MAVSGQLCRVAEGLSYHYITLAHLHPPPSPHKSETCAIPVQTCMRAAPFLQSVNTNVYHPGIRRAHGRYKLVPAKSRPCLKNEPKISKKIQISEDSRKS